MQNQADSTLLYPSLQREDSSTQKNVSFSIQPGESTGGDYKLSIFNLPKENIERLAEQERRREPASQERE